MRSPPEGGATPRAGARRETFRNTPDNITPHAPLDPRRTDPGPRAHLVVLPTRGEKEEYTDDFACRTPRGHRVMNFSVEFFPEAREKKKTERQKIEKMRCRSAATAANATLHPGT